MDTSNILAYSGLSTANTAVAKYITAREKAKYYITGIIAGYVAQSADVHKKLTLKLDAVETTIKDNVYDYDVSAHTALHDTVTALDTSSYTVALYPFVIKDGKYYPIATNGWEADKDILIDHTGANGEVFDADEADMSFDSVLHVNQTAFMEFSLTNNMAVSFPVPIEVTEGLGITATLEAGGASVVGSFTILGFYESTEVA